jgi:hypothetical protein
MAQWIQHFLYFLSFPDPLAALRVLPARRGPNLLLILDYPGALKLRVAPAVHWGPGCLEGPLCQSLQYHP